MMRDQQASSNRMEQIEASLTKVLALVEALCEAQIGQTPSVLPSSASETHDCEALDAIHSLGTRMDRMEFFCCRTSLPDFAKIDEEIKSLLPARAQRCHDIDPVFEVVTLPFVPDFPHRDGKAEEEKKAKINIDIHMDAGLNDGHVSASGPEIPVFTASSIDVTNGVDGIRGMDGESDKENKQGMNDMDESGQENDKALKNEPDQNDENNENNELDQQSEQKHDPEQHNEEKDEIDQHIEERYETLLSPEHRLFLAHFTRWCREEDPG